MNFVTAAILVYTIVYFVNVYTIAYHVHVYRVQVYMCTTLDLSSLLATYHTMPCPL